MHQIKIVAGEYYLLTDNGQYVLAPATQAQQATLLDVEEALTLQHKIYGLAVIIVKISC